MTVFLYSNREIIATDIKIHNRIMALLIYFITTFKTSFLPCKMYIPGARTL